MRRVLFVDDEPEFLQEYKRMLQPMRQEWGMSFANSGEEALDFMSKLDFDVVVSDMHMPKMDGLELLHEVMASYPNVVRIILSEDSDSELMLESVKCAHQRLTKPCDMEAVKYVITRACKLKDLLCNDALRKLVTGIKKLPSLPTLYSMIVKEMQSPNASLKKVGYIVSQDASMSAKVLQIVNSAYFGLPREVSDPQQAAVYLGVETLKSLILSVNVFSSFTEDTKLYGVSLKDMLGHCLLVGRLAKEIARSENAETKVLEEAMIAGVLHDIGKLILLQLPDQKRQVEDLIGTTGGSFVEVEYAVMKTSHAELGTYLLGLWGIPDSIIEIVAFHHNPSRLLEGIFANECLSSEDAGSDMSNEGGLVSQGAKKHLTEFTTLTAVHVANALLLQKDISKETTLFPYIDSTYLKTLNLENRLPRWVEKYHEVMREEV
ncbi:MAG: response regulator [Planctomycetes bacterium]|nr:response regulator [Planctomycetota bacterium]